MSTDIHYERVTKREVIPATGSLVVELSNLRQPFEDLTTWVQAIGPGNYTIEYMYNGQIVQTINATTQVPQKIFDQGIFSHNAPERLDDKSAQVVNGVVPSVKITNTGANRVFLVEMVARIYGAAV